MQSNLPSQFKLTVIGLLVLLLMANFWHYFERHKEDMLKTALASTAADFRSKIVLIHSKWRMLNKPNLVPIVQTNLQGEEVKDEKVIRVNKYGWPDLSLDHNACERIWHKILAKPMKVMNQNLFVIELNKRINDKSRVCRFQLNEKWYLQYNSKTGKVVTKSN